MSSMMISNSYSNENKPRTSKSTEYFSDASAQRHTSSVLTNNLDKKPQKIKKKGTNSKKIEESFLINANQQSTLGQCEIYTELEELYYGERSLASSMSSNLANNAVNKKIYEFRVRTRWIKYEQTLDTESDHWSKPFVGTLIYQNLITLKNKMQYASK